MEQCFLDKLVTIKQYARVIQSAVGCNSTIACGEVQNCFIAPLHEQHHNSSFLIAAGIGGQSNIASGANLGSNHNSRANDGTMEAVKTLSHTETSGVGTKAVDNGSDYRKNFFGKSREECAGVDTITGATISSAAFKKAVGIAFDAYDAVKETER